MCFLTPFKKNLIFFLMFSPLLSILFYGCDRPQFEKPTSHPKSETPTKPKVLKEDLKEGTGIAVRDGHTVWVHYRGYLTDGKEFDSSYIRNKPFKVTLRGERSGVIQGWVEGLQGMKTGGKRKLVIPPELGYGSQNQQNIPPNSTLIFEVSVVKIEE